MFRIFSPATGKCLSLANADQGDGGGLILQDCKNFPDFFVSGVLSSTALAFELNSRRFVCIFATDTPQITPSGELAPVKTRDCGLLQSSMWRVRGEDGGNGRQIEKLQSNGLDGTNFCMHADASTATVALDVCQGAPEQDWRFDKIEVPPLPG